MKTLFKCPAGHELKPQELHSTVLLAEPDINRAILFTCPGGKRGHEFTLEKAVAAGMFTEEEADRIRLGGKQHRAMYAKAGSR
jgi:hypothetical protein